MVSINQDIIEHINAISENQEELYKSFEDIVKRVDEMNKKLEKVSNDCDVIALNTKSLAEYQAGLNNAFTSLRRRLNKEDWMRMMQFRKNQLVLPPDEFEENEYDDDYGEEDAIETYYDEPPKTPQTDEKKLTIGGILKPFECKRCGRFFGYPHTLKHHMAHNCKGIKGGCGKRK